MTTARHHGPTVQRGLLLDSPQFKVLSEHVAQTLRDAIARGTLRPGERIVEQQVADEIGVSRAPVRDALRALVRDGLVSLVPHRGAVVTPISGELIADVFDVRASLEGLAARHAASQIGDAQLESLRRLLARMDEAAANVNALDLTALDVEFHRTVSVACRRPVLLASLDVINARRMLLIHASQKDQGARDLARVVERHTPILEALERRAPDAAEAAARAHVLFGKEYLLASLGAPKAEDVPDTAHDHLAARDSPNPKKPASARESVDRLGRSEQGESDGAKMKGRQATSN